jgi:hypothetical protein
MEMGSVIEVANHVSAWYACRSASSAAERHVRNEAKAENTEYQWLIKGGRSSFCLTLTTSQPLRWFANSLAVPRGRIPTE